MRSKKTRILILTLAAVAILLAIVLAVIILTSGDDRPDEPDRPAVGTTAPNTTSDGTTATPGTTAVPGSSAQDTTLPDTSDVGGSVPSCSSHRVEYWTTLSEATCSVEGVEEGLCWVCGQTVQRPIPTNDLHVNYSWMIVDMPTCTLEGLQCKLCDDCGETLESQVLDALWHDYETTVYDPTFESEGYTVSVCRRCGDTVTDVFAPKIEFATGLEYEVNYDGTATCIITGIGDCRDRNLYIPYTIDGLFVVGVDDAAFQECTQLESVWFPASVEKIGVDAFWSCENLESISFEEGSLLKGFDAEAFAHCGSLRYLEIPEGVTYIGNSAFAFCTSLDRIDLPSTLEKIGVVAFEGCQSLISVVVPDSVTEIGEEAFGRCNNLQSITVPFIGHSIEQDGAAPDAPYPFAYIFSSSAEGNCDRADYRYTMSGTNYIQTFYVPKSLKKVTLTGGNVVAGAFKGCKSIEQILLPQDMTYIGEKAFADCDSLVSIEIPEGVTEIGQEAFSYCDRLETVKLPSGLTRIATGLFCESEGLESIIIPKNVESIERSAFYRCKNLKEVVFEKGSRLSVIDAFAFYECTALTSIVLPADLMAIEGTAFVYSGLENALFEDPTGWYVSTSPTSLGDSVILTSAEKNAEYLTATYTYNYYWRHV